MTTITPRVQEQINKLSVIYNSVQATNNPNLYMALDNSKIYLIAGNGGILLEVLRDRGFVKANKDLVEYSTGSGAVYIARLLKQGNRHYLKILGEQQTKNSIDWNIRIGKHSFITNQPCPLMKVYREAFVLNMGDSNALMIFTKNGVCHNDTCYLRILQSKQPQVLIGVKHLTFDQDRRHSPSNLIREIHLLDHLGRFKKSVINEGWDDKLEAEHGYTLTNLYSRSQTFIDNKRLRS